MNRKFASWIFLIAGLLVMAYPLTAYGMRYFNDLNSVKQFSSGEMSDQEKESLQSSIEEYNKSLVDGKFNAQTEPAASGGAQPVSYYDFLQTGEAWGTLLMPKINEKLNIYYGSTENVLRVGVGLMENTSYPGTEGGNTVITGHRGTYDANIFRNIDQMAVGDVFYIQDKMHLFKYKISEISTVEPMDGRLIKLEEGRELVTLVTCTPYLINSHRLLIFAERTDFAAGEVEGLLGTKAKIVSSDRTKLPEIQGTIIQPEKTFIQQVMALSWELKAIAGVIALVLIGGLMTFVVKVRQRSGGVSYAKTTS